MIERYTRPAMGAIWSEAAKYEAWLRVEVAVCAAYARRGRIPVDVMARIRAARVDIGRILDIQRQRQARDDRAAQQPGGASSAPIPASCTWG